MRHGAPPEGATPEMTPERGTEMRYLTDISPCYWCRRDVNDGDDVEAMMMMMVMMMGMRRAAAWRRRLTGNDAENGAGEDDDEDEGGAG